MSRQRIMLTGAAAVAAALLLLLVVEVGWVRTLCAAAFCLLAPGCGWARRMHLKDRGDTLALTAVFSICATIAVGTAMAVTGWWSPVAGFAVLVLIAVCGFMPFRRTAAAHKVADPKPGTFSLEIERVSRLRVEYPARDPEGDRPGANRATGPGPRG